MTNTLSKPSLFLNSNPELRRAIHENVTRAIAEDVGSGDLTAQLIPASQTASARIISREKAVLCGIPWVEACFETLAPNCHIHWLVQEGAQIEANQTICEITGNAREILTAERTSLNFLQTLSATATLTKRYVEAIAGTSARVMDTRKTIPGLRIAQKYAVTIGGGLNQRMSLDTGILIKENHIMAAGSIEAAIQSAQAICSEIAQQVSIQIEVETLAQLTTAIASGASLILLDNFDIAQLKQAVTLNAGRAILEASGGIDLHNIREVALTGVDRISIGSLTKHIQAIDLSLRFTSAS